MHATLNRVLRQAVAARSVPGIAAVADGESTLYSGCFGIAGRDPARPMMPESIFRIASLTKLVTSVAVMLLVEEGKLDLDAQLADYLLTYRQPEVLVSFDANTRAYETRPAASAVTIRQLLSHTAGYGYWFLDPELLALVDGAPALLNPPFLMTDPGTRFAYSSSADVVGQVVEPLTGLGLDAFLEQRVFGPLGMRDTGWRLPRDRDRLVAAFRREAGGFAEVASERAGNTALGGNGLYSTGGDYLRLLSMLVRGGRVGGEALLTPASVESIRSNQIGELFAEPQTTALAERSNDFVFMDGTQKFGFGVMVETQDRDGARSAGSFGWGGILNTYFWVDPGAGLAAVIMMQLAPFADPACIEVCRRFEAAVYSAFV